MNGHARIVFTLCDRISVSFIAFHSAISFSLIGHTMRLTAMRKKRTIADSYMAYETSTELFCFYLFLAECVASDKAMNTP